MFTRRTPKLLSDANFLNQPVLDAAVGMVVAPLRVDCFCTNGSEFSVVDKRRRIDALDNLRNFAGVVVARRCQQLYGGRVYSHFVGSSTSGASD